MAILTFDPDRRTSAQAVLDLARLGFLDKGQLILDATYGKGRFWRLWEPHTLLTNDINPERGWNHYDFRHFPEEWDQRFDVTVFDPPFKLNGTGGDGPGDEAYGVEGKYDPGRMTMMEDGLWECLRVTKVGGLLIYKCQDQVSGGRRRWVSKRAGIVHYPGEYEASLIDELYIHGGARKQPHETQKHSLMNVSVLQVFRKNR